VQIIPTLMPQFSPVLLNQGITEGKVCLVIDVSAEGKLTDWLVLGYTDPQMVRTCVDALTDWDIKPARVDGEAVGAQVELTITITAEGVVISSSGPQTLDSAFRRLTGNPIKYKLSPALALDRVPTVINTVAPKYAQEAAKQGVTGKVDVHFYINEKGEVRMPAVKAGVHPYLANVAVSALREWKFEPPTSKGKPVLIAARQQFDFGGGK
jgi:TonB family protein